MERNEADTTIAVTTEDGSHRHVLDRAAERAREGGGTVILYDLDAELSPLESPLPTAWSGDHIDVTDTYPELRAMAESLGATQAVLDGVLVALDPSGRPSVELLQQRMTAERNAVTVERCLNQLIVVAEVQLARGLEIAKAERMEPQLPVEPCGSRVLEIQQDVMMQVVRRPERIRRILR